MLLKSSVKNFSYTGNDLDAKVHVLVGEITGGDGFETLKKKIKTKCFILLKNKFHKIANSHHFFLSFISHTQ